MLKIREAVVKYKANGRTAPSYITQPWEVYGFFKRMVAGATRERFYCVFLSNRNRVLCFEEVAVGTSRSASVDAKEIVRTALLVGAESVILIHNHPSGDIVESPSDVEMTKLIILALDPFRITVLDHLIIGEDEFLSFKQRGLI